MLALSRRFGPIAPHASVAIASETDTEVRTSITLLVRDSTGERRFVAEFGRLYFPRPETLVDIPLLLRRGKLASLTSA